MDVAAAILALAMLQGGHSVAKKDPTIEELIRLRVVLTVPGMDAVSVRRDLVYKDADGQPVHMDLYSPAGPPRPRPVVILIHGGPIPRVGAKNMGLFVSYGELLAASGFVAVTFNHRYLAPAQLAIAGDDVTALVTHVRANASSLGIDRERIALWAFSGGGPFLAHPMRDRPAWFRAVVAYYAVLDLEQPAPGDGSHVSPELRQAFSVRRSVGGGPTGPPILVARAGLDNAWLNAAIDRFVHTALERGLALDLLNHPDGRHSFDILDDDDRSKQIIQHTLVFLRDHLRP